MYGFDGFDNPLLKVELGVAPDLLEGLFGDVVPIFLAQAVDINIDRGIVVIVVRHVVNVVLYSPDVVLFFQLFLEI